MGAGMRSDRFQHQSPLVKAYRWVRHKPLWWAIGLYWVTEWVFRGFDMEPFERAAWGTRWGGVKWMLASADHQADVRMGRFWNLSEVIERYMKGEPFRAMDARLEDARIRL